MDDSNYYLHLDVCPHCGRGDGPLHIGQAREGWVFALHVNDEITSLADWVEAWSQPGAEIRDEHGDQVTPKEMRAVITKRSWTGPARRNAWYYQHHAQRGPKGLARQRLCHRCIAHGRGTYDLVPWDS